MATTLIRQLIAACFILAATVFPAAADEPPPKRIVITPETVFSPEAATIPLGDVGYDEIEPICKQMLSPKGTLGYFARRRAIIVYDNPKNIEKIREFIKSVDRPSVNVRLDVTFAGASKETDNRVGVQLGNRRQPPIVIENGKVELPDRIGIDARSHSLKETRDTTQTLVARSGSAARLWVGERAPDPAWLRARRFAPIVIVPGYATTVVVAGSEIPWRDVGSALYAVPTYRADGLVDVELFPVVSYRDGKGRRQRLRVQELETKVTVAPGQTISIGGVNDGFADAIRQFGGTSILGKTSKQESLDISLRATVQQPRKR